MNQFIPTMGLCLVIFVALIFVAIDVFGFNTYNWDAYLIWGMKARVLSHDPIMATDYFTQGWSHELHQRYPLFIPFQMAAINGLVGHVNDHLSKGIFLITTILLCLSVY